MSERTRQATPRELLRVDDLHVRSAVQRPAAERDVTSIDEILRGVDLAVAEGEVHAVVGPDGSGTSALGPALLGSGDLEVTAGSIVFLGDDVTDWPTDERAKAGMFLGFRHPQGIRGVSVIQFLRQAVSARTGTDLSVVELRLATMRWMQRLDIDSSFADRHLDESLPVGDRQRIELLQIAILEPELAILDQTDPGLHPGARRTVATGIRAIRAARPTMGVVLITHDLRLVDEVRPDHIHILLDGRIVQSGGTELAEQLQRNGHESFRVPA